MTDREKLTALMEKFAGGSQQAFAELIGVPRSNIATWMHRGSISATNQPESQRLRIHAGAHPGHHFQ